MTIAADQRQSSDSSPPAMDIGKRLSFGSPSRLPFPSAPTATANAYLVFEGGHIAAEVTWECQEYLAVDSVASRWGVGATEEDALDALADAVMDYYDDLLAHRDRLAPPVAKHLRILHRLLRQDAVRQDAAFAFF